MHEVKFVGGTRWIIFALICFALIKQRLCVFQCEQLFQYAAWHNTESCSAWQRTQQMFSRLCTDCGLLALGAWQSLSVGAISIWLCSLWPKAAANSHTTHKSDLRYNSIFKVNKYWGGWRVKYNEVKPNLVAMFFQTILKENNLYFLVKLCHLFMFVWIVKHQSISGKVLRCYVSSCTNLI